MENSKNLFDAFFEGQRKMMDWWVDASQKMMDAGTGKKEESNTHMDYMKELFDRQKALMEETAHLTSPKEIMEKAPEQYKKWMDLQVDFYNKWADAYRTEAEKMGFPWPELNGYAPDKAFQKNWSAWTDQMMQNQQWLQKNILEKLPGAMRPHYLNFTEIYEDMQRRWSAFQQMIQFGIYDQKMIERFFAPLQYKEMINKLMGLQFPSAAHEGMEKMNEMLNAYLKYMKQFSPSMDNWRKYWESYMEQWGKTGPASLMQATMDINQRLKDSMEPFLPTVGFNKMERYFQILKDAQFAYTAFALRTNELQSQLYQAGQEAMPETLKALYQEFRDSNQMPSFDQFFKHFIDRLEQDLTRVLDSGEYSQLQAEVSKMGVMVKAKLDELVELSFDQTPFMMKSSGDELSKELYSLRRKVRELEKAVNAKDKKKATKKTKTTK